MNYKNILIILILVILAEISWLVWRTSQFRKLQGEPGAREGVVKEEQGMEGEPVSEEMTKGAKLWLEPNEGEFSGQFIVDIFVQTPEPIDGLDVRLLYPKEKLLVVDQDVESEGIQIQSGNFEEYPINKVDEEKGLVLLSGIVLKKETTVPLEQPFLVGKVVFETAASGEVNLDFDFEPESTTDSNVAGKETQGDILTEVKGARFDLK